MPASAAWSILATGSGSDCHKPCHPAVERTAVENAARRAAMAPSRVPSVMDLGRRSGPLRDWSRDHVLRSLCPRSDQTACRRHVWANAGGRSGIGVTASGHLRSLGFPASTCRACPPCAVRSCSNPSSRSAVWHLPEYPPQVLPVIMGCAHWLPFETNEKANQKPRSGSIKDFGFPLTGFVGAEDAR